MEEFKYLIPEESNDATRMDASLMRIIEGHLRRTFNAHDYQELLLPTFEYADLLSGFGTNEETMFQFINHEGKRITLRTDFTVPIARIYSNAHTDEVRRYSYFGKVYRTQARHKGRSSELFQGGIELFGLPGREGDQECLSLIEETMQNIGLSDLKLELGSAKFYKRLMTLVMDRSLTDILKKKKSSDMKHLVEAHDFDEDLNKLLLILPSAFGNIKCLREVKEIVKDDELLEAIEEMESLYEFSKHKENIIFDLCMVPERSYYTGIMMKGFSYYSAHPILQGGRYDHLFDHFYKNVPSIGFSYHLNNVLDAIGKENEAND